MKFTEEEKDLIEGSYARYLEEHNLSKKDYPLNEETIRTVIQAAHDKYVIIVTPAQHKLMRDILRKAGQVVLEPVEEEKRQEEERRKAQKEAKRRMKEKLEREYKEEMERKIKELGLVENDTEEDEKPPRKDVTHSEIFNNIVETLQKKVGEEENAEVKKEIEKEIPEIDYGDLSNNTVVELKEVADFMELDYRATILKDDLIKLIKDNLNKE